MKPLTKTSSLLPGLRSQNCSSSVTLSLSSRTMRKLTSQFSMQSSSCSSFISPSESTWMVGNNNGRQYSSSSVSMLQSINNIRWEKQKALEEYLYKNKSFDCLMELFDSGVLNFSESVYAAKDGEFVNRLLELKPGCVRMNDLLVEFKDKERLLKLKFIQFSDVPEVLKKDKDIILKALETGLVNDLPEMEQYIQEDEEFAVKAIQIQGTLIKHASEKLKNKKSLIMKAIASSPHALEFLSDKFRADKAFVLKAVKKDGSVLRFASEELRSDPEVVLQAVKSAPYSLSYASEELKNDPNIAMTAIKTGNIVGLRSRGMGNIPHLILEIVGRKLLRDKPFMIKALAMEPCFSLSCDCEEALRDPEVLLSLNIPVYQTTIDQHLNNTNFAKKYFKKLLSFEFNKELASILFKQIKPLDGVYQLLKNKEYFIRNALEIIDNRDLALKAVNYLRKIPEKYRSDREFVLDVLKEAPYRFDKTTINPELLSDKEFISKAMDLDPYFLTMASEKLRQDVDLLRKTSSSSYLPPEIIHKIPRLLALEMVCKDGLFLSSLHPDLSQDREIVYKAILNNPRAIIYADESLQKDKKLIHMIMDKGLLFRDIHPDIQYDFDILKRVFEINKFPCAIK